MGRGDKKTAKGKRTMGSYGNTRKRSSEKVVVAVVEKPAKAEKTPAKKTSKKETAK